MRRSRARSEYYAVLGVPAGSSGAVVRRAFRARAQECHPDVSDDPAAETQFREIVEAHEALSDSRARAPGAAAGRGARAHPARFSRPPAEVAAELTVDYMGAQRGTAVDVEFAFERTCQQCRGEGVEPGASPETCAGCDGDGWRRGVSSSSAGRWIQVETCPKCAGTGVVANRCVTCGGLGRTPGTRSTTVQVPRHVADGQRLRVGGVGHVDSAGSVGDGFVVVRVWPLPDAPIVRLVAAVGIIGALVLLAFVIAL